jgi:N-acetylneuraminic acid mutarotase
VLRGILRLVITIPLLVIAALVAMLLILILTNPSPRDAPGWALAAPMPDARGETTSAVLDGRLYVVGGMTGLGLPRTADGVAVYDPQTDTWTTTSRLPQARHHTAAAALDGALYVSGGAPSVDSWTPEPNLWRLTGVTWTDLSPMPEGRWGHRMIALDGRLYVVGGVGGSAVLIYDPDADAWSRGAPIPAARDHLAVVAAEGEIWVIAGRLGDTLHDRVDIYDPGSDTWRAGPDLPAPTSGAAEAARDGLILISGGEGPPPLGEGVIDRHWWIDARAPDAGWRPMPRPPLAIHGVEGAVINGRFYVPGGATRAGAQSFASWVDELQVFDLAQLGRR